MVDNYEDMIKEAKILYTRQLILRPYAEGDEADVLEYGSDKETLKYVVWTGVTTIEDARTAILDYYILRDSVYGIEHRESGKLIGGIDFSIQAEHEKASFGYILNRRYWNKGYMTEALKTLIDMYFRVVQLNRIEATHYAGNEGSGRVMEKCGMKKEGIGQSEVKVKGVFHDVIHYGITKRQWADNLL